MILILDNYDSFTWNLVDLVRCQTEVVVLRTDEITLEEVQDLSPKGILISPGPGKPANSPASLEIVRRYQGVFPILGVCLGHQIIGEVYGVPTLQAASPMHGKTSEIHHDGKGLFAGMPDPLTVMRYHSLILEETAFPAALEKTAVTTDGTIMGLRHRELPVWGVQFHPESILSVGGGKMITNWLCLLD